MKLRLLCVAAALSAFVGTGHAAEAGKNGDASDNGLKKLTIPSVEMSGGSLGVSTKRPDDPPAPGFNDPQNQDERRDPFVGLKFNKPLGNK